MTAAPSKRHQFWADQQFGRGVGSILIVIGGWLGWQGSRPAAGGWTMLAVRTLLVLLGSGLPGGPRLA